MSNPEALLEMANSYKNQYGIVDNDYRDYLMQYYNSFDPSDPRAVSAARMLADSYREQYGDADNDYRTWLERTML